MSSAAPAQPSIEERLEAAEARAAAAETARDRLLYRLKHLTRAYDAIAPVPASRREPSSSAPPPPPPSAPPPHALS